MPWLELVGAKEVGALVFFDKLSTCSLDGLRQDEGVECAPRFDLKQQAAVPAIVCALDGLAGIAIGLQILDEAIGKLVVLLGSLFGCERFDGCSQ